MGDIILEILVSPLFITFMGNTMFFVYQIPNIQEKWLTNVHKLHF
jgi:hypothetical protein